MRAWLKMTLSTQVPHMRLKDDEDIRRFWWCGCTGTTFQAMNKQYNLFWFQKIIFERSLRCQIRFSISHVNWSYEFCKVRFVQNAPLLWDLGIVWRKKYNSLTLQFLAGVLLHFVPTQERSSWKIETRKRLLNSDTLCNIQLGSLWVLEYLNKFNLLL